MSQHTYQARAIARDTGWDLDGFASDRGWSGVGIGPVGEHRDSDALERSNFRVTYPDMVTRFGDAVQRVTFGHWAVGWVAEIAYDAGRADIVAYDADTRARIADYPALDETDWSDMEWSDHHPEGTRECYAPENAECPCRYATLLRMVRRIGTAA